MIESLVGGACSLESLVGRLADEFLRRQDAGEQPDVEEYVARHPEAADLLRKVLTSLQLLDTSLSGGASLATGDGDGAAMGTLGDFRLVREVGRGGMGIVYEAVQISLNRRVALKVLPFAATMDPRHLQRFHNEAQAAASLHHTNIVPVYFVGCERSVHFYAMQFIDGRSLAAILEEPQGGPSVSSDPPTTAYAPPPAPGGPASETAARAAATTVRQPRDPSYFRRVAEWGIQAAEALDHAHQMGIVHRDVKPANLLVDAAGRLWVTDFGLAQVQSDTKLTMTGDLVGTLRYMSPEQALAKRVVIDHRTDVYSLGATLYELLTLQPAFGGSDRQELLRQIAFEEPRPPRRLNKAIPAELETIVLKATQKNPAERYATAQELADDLRRWVEDRPIKARRPSLRQLTARWVRRHRPLVGAAALVALLVIVLGGGTWLWLAQQRAGAEGRAREALAEAERLKAEERWPEAMSAVKRASGILEGFGADKDLLRQVKALGKDIEMEQKLLEADLRGTAFRDGVSFDKDAANEAFADAFRWYGLDVERLEPEEAARRIRSRSIAVQLVAALDRWWTILDKTTFDKRDERKRHLLAVARAADLSPWRNRIRTFTERPDKKDIEEWMDSFAKADVLSVEDVKFAARLSGMKEEPDEQTVAILRRAQHQHPGDYWINQHLAECLWSLSPPRWEEAARYFAVCAAIRPQSPLTRYNLGYALGHKGDLDGAIAELKEAIRLKPNLAEAHTCLGKTLAEKGDLDGAVAACQKAIRLKPNLAEAHNNLGVALINKRNLDGAIAEFKEAIKYRPNYAEAYSNLGNALRDKGNLDGAIAECKKAIRFNKDFSGAHLNLGVALIDKGDLDGAIDEYKEAIRLRPDFAEAHNNLGAALIDRGDLDGAIAECKKAIELKPNYVEAYYNLGNALRDKGNLDGAIAKYKEVIHLKKDDDDAYSSLGRALLDKKDLDGAIAECRKAIHLNAKNAHAHNNLGNALNAKGNRDEAIAAYKEAIRLRKDFAEAHYNLGLALRDKGDPDGAITEFNEAIKGIRNKPKLAEAHNNLGLALRDKGDPDGAIAEFKEAIRLNPDLATAHSNLGAALDEKGDLDGAIAKHKEAIRLRPDFAEAHNNLGAALLMKGDLDGAIAGFKEAIRLKKHYFDAHQNLGLALHQKRDWDGAIVAFKEAIRLKPDFAAGHNNLGNALNAKGNRDEAIAAYKEAIRLRKDFAEAHYNLGNALSDKGDLDGAIKEFNEAIRLKPGYAEAHRTLADCLHDTGDLEGSIAEYKKAIRLKPDNSEDHNNFGTALEDKNDWDRAIKEFNEAIRLKPDNAEAHFNLGWVLRWQGKFSEAATSFRRCHELTAKDSRQHDRSAELVKQCQAFIELDSKLSRFLKHELQPANADERLALAQMCQLGGKSLHAAAARFYADAFAERPLLADDLQRMYRYNAACAAAQAGCRQGKDADNLDDRKRASLRQQALKWLRDDLVAWQRLMKKDPRGFLHHMRHLQKDEDFAAVRDPKALARLPESERSAWENLWEEVKTTLRKAEAKSLPDRKPAPTNRINDR
jgi:tetratricopeptide (TPR) repeat protein